ncbi:hypothetical protein SAMN06272737_1237 [Blastococcus mobilis]|uniref:Uncharacterized protein n=1 Tax=Blastococcus mobilis TaxID=1938746 RepID=A0A238YVQ9_9ACTN|nr:hypothetical protein SAMN06272737_1237 [Blastococcus mobilis]
MSCPTAGADSSPQNAVSPPEKQAADGKVAPVISAPVMEPRLRSPRPGIEEMEVVGDGLDREEA